jgi:hypothetical protein
MTFDIFVTPSNIHGAFGGGIGMEMEMVLPPFRNIRCFSFMKWMYLDIF